MKIAFYKGKGNTFDTLTRLWTKSKYSHVELIDSHNNWITSSPRDGGVVKRSVDFHHNNWDVFEINIDEKEVMNFFNEELGKKYDWLGIFFSQIIKLNIHNKSRWFCSEIIHAALIVGGMSKLHFKASNKYNPGSLFNMLSGIGEIH